MDRWLDSFRFDWTSPELHLSKTVPVLKTNLSISKDQLLIPSSFSESQ